MAIARLIQGDDWGRILVETILTTVQITMKVEADRRIAFAVKNAQNSVGDQQNQEWPHCYDYKLEKNGLPSVI